MQYIPVEFMAHTSVKTEKGATFFQPCNYRRVRFKKL